MPSTYSLDRTRDTTSRVPDAAGTGACPSMDCRPRPTDGTGSGDHTRRSTADSACESRGRFLARVKVLASNPSNRTWPGTRTSQWRDARDDIRPPLLSLGAQYAESAAWLHEDANDQLATFWTSRALSGPTRLTIISSSPGRCSIAVSRYRAKEILLCQSGWHRPLRTRAHGCLIKCGPP
jgi:hypothetical protein